MEFAPFFCLTIKYYLLQKKMGKSSADKNP